MKNHPDPKPYGAIGLLAALIFASLAAPAAADHGRKGVTLYAAGHFRGHYETFYGDVPDLRGTRVGNDHLSSIVVPRGCRVTLYSKGGYRGTSVTLHHDVADMRRTPVGNDHVSSLRVDCYGGRRGGYGGGYGDGRYGSGYSGERYDDYGGGRHRDYDDDSDSYRYGRGNYGDGGHGHPRGVTVFAGGDFSGHRETFTYDDADLRNNRIRQDTISSVVVSPGCRAVLFEDIEFRGRAAVVTGDVSNMRYSAVGNDRVSSIQVDCRRRR